MLYALKACPDLLLQGTSFYSACNLCLGECRKLFTYCSLKCETNLTLPKSSFLKGITEIGLMSSAR